MRATGVIPQPDGLPPAASAGPALGQSWYLDDAQGAAALAHELATAPTLAAWRGPAR